MNYLFWDGILEYRIDFIKKIDGRALKLGNQHGHNICVKLLKWLRKLDGNYLRSSIEQIKNEYYEYKI